MKLRTLRSVLLGTLLLLMLAWAWHLKDPRLIVLRPVEGPLLLAASILVGVWAWVRPRGSTRTLTIWAACVSSALTLCHEITYQYRKQVVLNPTPEAMALGQHFIVGYTDPHVIRELVGKGLVGGVFITARNVRGQSAQAVQAEIAELQALRQQAGLPPLLISTDQEGGAVSRMTPPLPYHDNLAGLAQSADDSTQLVARAYSHGQQQGRELASLGVNVNFSPVVDLKVDRGRDLLDFHTQISSRAISADPLRTTLIAQAYSLGLQSQGVSATLKHFPGLGDVTSDTHLFDAELNTPVRTLRERDWRPFRDVAAHTQALIMLGHVVVPEIDADAPASMSRPLIQTVIRGEWGHQGALVTDDLTMAAAYDRGLCKVVPQALNAGVDLLLIAFDEDKFIDAMYCAIQAQRQQRLDKDTLEQSTARLQKLRAGWRQS